MHKDLLLTPSSPINCLLNDDNRIFVSVKVHVLETFKFRSILRRNTGDAERQKFSKCFCSNIRSSISRKLSIFAEECILQTWMGPPQEHFWKFWNFWNFWNFWKFKFWFFFWQNLIVPNVAFKKNVFYLYTKMCRRASKMALNVEKTCSRLF